MFTLTIQANTIEELNEKIAGITVGYPREAQPAPKMEHFPVAETKVETVETAPPVDMTYTAEQTRAILNNLRERKGSQIVKSLLNAHGANSFTELNVDLYARIIEEALQILEGE